MRVDKGVVAVSFTESEEERKYVALKRDKNWSGWEMPKGHLEEDDYDYSVVLELKEEAGVEEEDIISKSPLMEDGRQKEISWEYTEDGNDVRSEFKVFVVKLRNSVELTTEKNPHEEHEKAEFMEFRRAKDKLEHPEQREVLKLVHDRLAF